MHGHPHPRRYTSKVTLHCPTAVHSRVDDSTLFSHLTNKWEFRCAGQTPQDSARTETRGTSAAVAMAACLTACCRAPSAASRLLRPFYLLTTHRRAPPPCLRRLGPTPHTTWLTFEVDFAFKSPLYRQVASIFFEEVGGGIWRHLSVPTSQAAPGC